MKIVIFGYLSRSMRNTKYETSHFVLKVTTADNEIKR